MALEVSGDLNRDGGIDGVKLEVRAENVPAFSTEKLMEIEKVKGELKAVLGGKGRAREKQAAVLEIAAKAIERASDIPVGFLVSLVSDRHELEMDFKEKTRATKLHAETGNGRYALTFSDILDGENRGNEVDLGAKVEGSVSEDKRAVRIDSARIYTADAISLSWGEDGRPVAHKVDAETGEKKPVDDHLAEIMQYLPMALALAGRRDF